MNQVKYEGRWQPFNGNLRRKSKSHKPNSNDINIFTGKRNKLISRVQQEYGKTRLQAEQEVDAYLSRLKIAQQQCM